MFIVFSIFFTFLHPLNWCIQGQSLACIYQFGMHNICSYTLFALNGWLSIGLLQYKIHGSSWMGDGYFWQFGEGKLILVFVFYKTFHCVA